MLHFYAALSADIVFVLVKRERRAREPPVQYSPPVHFQRQFRRPLPLTGLGVLVILGGNIIWCQSLTVTATVVFLAIVGSMESYNMYKNDVHMECEALNRNISPAHTVGGWKQCIRLEEGI